MKTIIYIPVLDTVSKNFDYDGELSVSDYNEMVFDNFNRTNEKIDAYVNSYGMNESEKTTETRTGGEYDIDNTDGEGYQLRPCEAYVTDMDGKSANVGFFETHVEKGDMSILIVDINPEKIDWDTCSELKFWISESDRILLDKEIDDDAKIKMLPKTHFLIDVKEKRLKLNGCKLIEKYNEKNHPYKFGLLINKITE